MVETTTLHSILEGRANTYRLLSRLLISEIDGELLAELRAMKFAQGTGNEDVDRGFRLMHSFLNKSGERTLSDLEADYVAALIGSGTDGHSAAYPYESVYTSEDHLVMQDARDEVRALYRSCGLEQSESWKDGEDHLGVELEFMAVLATRTVQALDEKDEARAHRLLLTQRHFLEDHPSAWIPGFVELMLRFAKTDFYRGVACLLRGFVAQDLAFLQEIAEDERIETIA